MKIRKEDYKFVLSTNSQHLIQAKEVDDNAFGKHHGITMKELQKIQIYGEVILLCYKPENKIVGEIQFLYQHIPELPYNFQFPIGYCYGVGVLPQYRCLGCGSLLFEEQERVAKEKKIEEIHMSVRVENYPSLKLMFGCGCEIFDYRANFYGTELSDARLLVRQVYRSVTKSNSNGFIEVPVVFGDKHDSHAHQEILQLIANGYKGVGISCKGLYFSKT